MRTSTRTTRRDETQRRDSQPRDGEHGFALVWFALVLTALMAMAGAAVDLWDWWYNGNQQQRAADAAALGGAPFLPEDPSSARATAVSVAGANGIDPSELLIELRSDDPTLEANQIRVTVERNVPTRFMKLVGVGSADVSRDAVAEFTSRLPMGSPEQNLGRDPEEGKDPGFWLSVSGRGEQKVGGDRYQNSTCGPNYVYNCSSGSSIEYSDQGYAFSIRLDENPTGDLVIEAYDPVHVNADAQDCTNNTRLPTTGPTGYDDNIGTIQGLYPSDTQAAARYAPDDTIYCPGDVGGGNHDGGGANVTTFIVREPDTTQADDFDNPPISGAAVNTTPFDDGTCTRQFRAVNLRPFGSTRTIYEILAENAGGSAAQNQAASQAAQAVFRQWVPLCRIPAATAQSWYASGLRSVIVQVRSNAALGAPFTGDNVARGGRNHFALRAGYGTGTTPSGVSIFALGRLPIHNGAAGNSTTEFFLTRVPPGNAGRTLSLDFYDVADAAGSADFEVVPPTGFGANFNDCTFNRFEGNNDGSNSNVGLGSASVDPSNGCRLNGITNAQYNGRLAEVRVRVPTGYTCDLTMALDCWIKVRVTYNTGGGKVFDHTVWDAGVVGEPVRLIE